MILIISPYSEIQPHVVKWEAALAEPIRVVVNLRQATAKLRASDFSLVVVDQSLLEAEPEEGDLMLQHVGTAVPLYLNFAVSGSERVVRELRAAQSRRRREEVLARRAAEQALQNELKSAITAIQLACDLALEVRGIPAAAVDKIRTAAAGIRDLRTRMGLKDLKPSVPKRETTLA
jgi:hypothetical protein